MDKKPQKKNLSKTLFLRVTPEMHERLHAQAKSQGWKATKYLRLILENSLKPIEQQIEELHRDGISAENQKARSGILGDVLGLGMPAAK